MFYQLHEKALHSQRVRESLLWQKLKRKKSGSDNSDAPKLYPDFDPALPFVAKPTPPAQIADPVFNYEWGLGKPWKRPKKYIQIVEEASGEACGALDLSTDTALTESDGDPSNKRSRRPSLKQKEVDGDGVAIASPPPSPRPAPLPSPRLAAKKKSSDKSRRKAQTPKAPKTAKSDGSKSASQSKPSSKNSSKCSSRNSSDIEDNTDDLFAQHQVAMLQLKYLQLQKQLALMQEQQLLEQETLPDRADDDSAGADSDEANPSTEDSEDGSAAWETAKPGSNEKPNVLRIRRKKSSTSSATCS